MVGRSDPGEEADLDMPGVDQGQGLQQQQCSSSGSGAHFGLKSILTAFEFNHFLGMQS